MTKKKIEKHITVTEETFEMLKELSAIEDRNLRAIVTRLITKEHERATSSKESR